MVIQLISLISLIVSPLAYCSNLGCSDQSFWPGRFTIVTSLDGLIADEQRSLDWLVQLGGLEPNICDDLLVEAEAGTIA